MLVLISYENENCDKIRVSLMFVPCIIRLNRNTTNTELYHSFPARKHNRQNHSTPAHRPHKHTLYNIPPIRSVFKVTQTDLRSSLMMEDHCRNM
jgi:hypothetical protein